MPLSPRLQSFKRRFGAIIREIPEKRISCTQREKTQLDPARGRSAPKNSINDLVRRAVAAHRQKSSIALVECFRGEFRGVRRARGGNHVNAEAAILQAAKFSSGPLGGAPASSRGIHDGQKLFVHKGSTKKFYLVWELNQQDGLFAIQLSQARRQGYADDL
jgi:hypothetical protein